MNVKFLKKFCLLRGDPFKKRTFMMQEFVRIEFYLLLLGLSISSIYFLHMFIFPNNSDE